MTNRGRARRQARHGPMYVKMEKDNKPSFASIEKTTRIAPRGVDILDKLQFVRFRFNLYVLSLFPKLIHKWRTKKNGCV